MNNNIFREKLEISEGGVYKAIQHWFISKNNSCKIVLRFFNVPSSSIARIFYGGGELFNAIVI